MSKTFEKFEKKVLGYAEVLNNRIWDALKVEEILEFMVDLKNSICDALKIPRKKTENEQMIEDWLAGKTHQDQEGQGDEGQKKCG